MWRKIAKQWDGSFIDVGLCFSVCTEVVSVFLYKKASEIGGVVVEYFAYVSISVFACERHLCYVEGENEDSCSFFASLIEFN